MRLIQSVFVRRTIRCLLSFAFIATPLVRVNAQMIPTPAKHFKTANEGKFPRGWKVLIDDTNKSVDSTVLTEMAPGWHIKSGPSALFWSPEKHTARGTFTATAIMYLGPPNTSVPIGYGMFFGGKNMGTPSATYTEFLVRNDGYFMVRRHEGAKVVMLHDWSYIAGIGRHGRAARSHHPERVSSGGRAEHGDIDVQ